MAKRIIEGIEYLGTENELDIIQELKKWKRSLEPIPDPKARERELRDKLEGRKHFFGMPDYRFPNTHKGKDFTPNEIALLNYPKRDKLNKDSLLIPEKEDLIPEKAYLDYLEGHKLNKDSLSLRTTFVSDEQYFRMLGELFNMDEDIAKCFVEALEGQTYSITDAKPINKSFTSFEKRKITEDYQAGLEQAF